MKYIHNVFYAATVAMMCGGCGSADPGSKGESVAHRAQPLDAPIKGSPPTLNGDTFISDSTTTSHAGGGVTLASDDIYAVNGSVVVYAPIVRRALDDQSQLVHSLAEMSAQDPTQNQTVEIGWIVYDDDPTPRLFVFNWVDHVGQCAFSGIPHFTCPAFISTSDTIKPDMALNPGDTIDIGITHVDSGADAGWHFTYDGTDFGWMPDSTWTTPFQSVKIGEWFGEVAGSNTTRCSQMGNGRLGDSDPNADIFTVMQFTVRGQGPTDARMNLIQDEPSRYTAGFDGTQFQAPIAFGGPYSDAADCPALPCVTKSTCCEGTVLLCANESCPIICPSNQ